MALNGVVHDDFAAHGHSLAWWPGARILPDCVLVKQDFIHLSED